MYADRQFEILRAKRYIKLITEDSPECTVPHEDREQVLRDLRTELKKLRIHQSYGSFGGYANSLLIRLSRNRYLFPSDIDAVCVAVAQKMDSSAYHPSFRKSACTYAERLMGMINGDNPLGGLSPTPAIKRKFLSLVKRADKQKEKVIFEQKILEFITKNWRGCNAGFNDVWRR